MKPLVSVITPCYNGGKYIDRYAHSMLAQDYDHLQIIFMDDGSTDGSREKIFAYQQDFEKKGYILEYHRHENKGQAYTVGAGLQYVKGKYLIWPDVDDTMTSDSISKKVKFFETHGREYGIVRTNFKCVTEEEPQKEIGHGAHGFPGRNHEWVFDDYIRWKNAWYQNGCFMVRMDAFRYANPDLFMYDSPGGQNIQMLFPVFYHFKCGYMDEPLFIYYLHKNSHSAKAHSGYRNTLNQYNYMEKTVEETVKHMNITDEKKYLRMNYIAFLKKKIDLSFDYKKRKEAKYYFRLLRKSHAMNFKYLLKANTAGFVPMYQIQKVWQLILRIYREII